MVPMGLFIALCSYLPSSEVSFFFYFYYSFLFSEDKSYLRSVSISDVSFPPSVSSVFLFLFNVLFLIVLLFFPLRRYEQMSTRGR